MEELGLVQGKDYNIVTLTYAQNPAVNHANTQHV